MYARSARESSIGRSFVQCCWKVKQQAPLATDAQLAALTVECGGVLHTTDRDFARFPGLRWINPLAS